MISVLSKSPSVARLADTDILLPFAKQPCQSSLPGFFSRVILGSPFLYFVFSLVWKRNNSLSAYKKLFLIGPKTNFNKSITLTLKQYLFTITIERFLLISYIITPISKTFTSRSKSLTLYRHTFTLRKYTMPPKSEESTPRRQTFTPRRQTLTPRSRTIADKRHILTPNNKVHTTFKYSVLPEK